MDLTILWFILGALGIVGISTLITIVVKKLKEKGKTVADILEGVDVGEAVFVFAKSLALEMFSKDDEILKNIDFVADAVEESLVFLAEQIDEGLTKEQKVDSMLDYLEDLMKGYDITLNDSQKVIIKVILQTTYNMLEALVAGYNIQNY